MIQLKKTILTLVALLAVTTGAWATDPKVYDSGEVELFSLQEGDILMPGVTLTNVDVNNFAGANIISNRYSKDGVISQYSNSISSIPFSIGENGLLTAELAGDGPYNCMPITEDGKAGNAWVVMNIVAFEPNYKTILIGGTTYPAPTGSEVAWDKAKKTGTFTMPGGNVTVSVEYYDLATLADKGLTAAEDAAAKTEAPLAVLADGAVTGGTLMYFVIYDENFSQADAIALAEDEWEAAIPTAETIEAAGTYYVWYYIKGDDEHSDTDPQRLAVTVLPEPTYNVEFAEGTNNAPNKWTATPNPAKKGQQVTVTYEGPRKVMGVKAEKKAEAKTLAEATLEDIGKIAGKDGKIYATKADAEAVATGNAVAMIAYVGTASDCAHGLAIALKDVSNEQLTWNNSGSNNESKTAAEWCSAWNTSKAVTGGTWRLPSISDWQYMFIGCGASESYSDNPIQMSYSGLASKLTTAQGDALPVNDDYWSSTVASPSYPWTVLFGDSYAFFGNNTWEGHAFDLVRACLAF